MQVGSCQILSANPKEIATKHSLGKALVSAGAFAILVLMETQPNDDKVVYMDEYPHITERLRLRRMGQLALFPQDFNQLILFPTDGEPDNIA